MSQAKGMAFVHLEAKRLGEPTLIASWGMNKNVCGKRILSARRISFQTQFQITYLMCLQTLLVTLTTDSESESDT
jgi:hypothetical protein